MKDFSAAPKGLVTKWFPDKGYGFVTLNGRRAFVHVSDVEPYQQRGVDLAGETLVVYATEESQKGLRVSRAVTLEEHERNLAEEAERQRQENARLAEEARIKREAENFLKSRSGELLEKLSALLAEGKVVRHSQSDQSIDLGDKQLHAQILCAESRVLTEEPLRLTAELFAEVQRYAGNGYTLLAKTAVGPIATFTVEGWGGLKIGPWENSPARVVAKYTGETREVSWNKETLLATIGFVAKDIPAPVFFHREFPVIAEAPYRDREKVMQKVLCHTPCGDVEHLLELHPKRDYCDYPTYLQVWGGYDISALVAEASLYASEQEVRACLAEKFRREGVPSVWEESGSAYTPHEDVGCGMHGGDYASITYTNKVFAEEVERLYAMDLRKEILAEVAKIPAEAEALGWTFKAPQEWPFKEWPAEFVSLQIVGRMDNDLKGYNIPRWVSPVRKPKCRKALDAVLAGATARDAVAQHLGPCPKGNPLEIQRLAGWARREWRSGGTSAVPKVSAALTRRVEKLLARVNAKKARVEAAEANARREQDITSVRKDWRAILNWRAASGGYRGLHPDAKDLLEKIRIAQEKARGLEMRRGLVAAKAEGKRAAAEIVANAQREEARKPDFLSTGTWDKLNDLKL